VPACACHGLGCMCSQLPAPPDQPAAMAGTLPAPPLLLVGSCMALGATQPRHSLGLHRAGV
jgi:hypothetical protein